MAVMCMMGTGEILTGTRSGVPGCRCRGCPGRLPGEGAGEASSSVPVPALLALALPPLWI